MRTTLLAVALLMSTAGCQRWQSYQPAGESFSAQFPGRPEELLDRDDSPAGFGSARVASARSGETLYVLRVTDLSDVRARGRSAKELLLDAQRQAKNAVGGALQSEHEHTLLNRPALDFRLRHSDGRMSDHRVVADGQRTYAMSVVVPKGTDPGTAARAFLDHLTLPAAAGAPAPGAGLVNTAPPIAERPSETCQGTTKQEETEDHLGQATLCLDGTGVRNGPYRARFPTGKDKETGGYITGKKSGLWVRYRADGTRESESDYVDDQKSGRETLYDVKGERTAEGGYKDGKRHGAWREYGQGGSMVLETSYVAGLKEGRETQHYENGPRMKEGAYAADKRHGLWTYYHRNGQMAAQGSFVAGQETGLWKQWLEDGRPNNSLEYKNGEARVVDDVATCPAGTIKARREHYRGAEEYCEKETKSPYGYNSNYRHAVRHGPYFLYDDKGNVMESGKYNNGNKEGRWVRVNYDGTQLEEIYKAGRLVTQQKK